MTPPQTVEDPALKLGRLPETVRVPLARRLQGLYGAEDDRVFDALAVDKQQALLILMRRFLDLELWSAVRRIENLYGERGVGMNFSTWPFMKSTLESRGDFTTWFARHRNTTRGFIERRTGRASLHILHAGDETTRGWEAHFDLYNPWSSPLNAWRHLLHEKIRKETPDWRAIGGSLGYIKSPATRIAP